MVGPGKDLENTCNAILTEELKKLGLNANFENQFWSLEGVKKPDIFIDHEDYYIIEAKKSPKKLIDAIGDAYAKKEALKNSLSLGASFGVLYNSEDCYGSCEIETLLERPPYILAHKTKTIQELAKWINDFILKPPLPTEINTSNVINLLKQTVNTLNPLFAKLDEKDVSKIFGGKLFFDTVLGSEKTGKVSVNDLRRASSYVLINQILFYQVLAKKTGKFIPLEPGKLREPAELQNNYFSKVLEKKITNPSLILIYQEN